MLFSLFNAKKGKDSTEDTSAARRREMELVGSGAVGAEQRACSSLMF